MCAGKMRKHHMCIRDGYILDAKTLNICTASWKDYAIPALIGDITLIISSDGAKRNVCMGITENTKHNGYTILALASKVAHPKAEMTNRGYLVSLQSVH